MWFSDEIFEILNKYFIEIFTINIVKFFKDLGLLVSIMLKENSLHYCKFSLIINDKWKL